MSDVQVMHAEASFCPDHFEPLFAAEDRHFWFCSRNRCIAAVARLIRNPGSVRDVIEHGCGTGFVLRELQRVFPNARVVGADLFPEALRFARQRFNGELVKCDILDCDYKEAFDLVGLFDVLEHLDDDLAVLRALRNQLRPGGSLLMTVPAHMSLWSDYDVASGHRRRYTRSQLLDRLSQAGFQTQFCSSFMCALLPIMWLSRRFRRKVNGSELQLRRELQVSPLLSRALETLLWPEVYWLRKGHRLPEGTSIIALATRYSD